MGTRKLRSALNALRVKPGRSAEGEGEQCGGEFGTKIILSSHPVDFLLSLVAWVMETQRKLSHSKYLILNIFGWLLLPNMSESSLYICLIT